MLISANWNCSIKLHLTRKYHKLKVYLKFSKRNGTILLQIFYKEKTWNNSWKQMYKVRYSEPYCVLHDLYESYSTYPITYSIMLITIDASIITIISELYWIGLRAR